MQSAGSVGGRLRFIDTLRGVAALLVVWMHVSQCYVGVQPESAVRGRWLYDAAQDFDVGRIGVVVFFLISGFVIPFSIRPGAPAPVTGFAIKRFFRIYPAYWLSVPVGAFATCWLWGQPFGTGEFLINLTLLEDLFGVREAQGVYWTLLVELAFYALCIVLLLTNSLRDGVRIGLLAAALAGGHAAVIALVWKGILPLPPLQPVTFFALHLSLMLCGTLYRLCWFEPGGGHGVRATQLCLGLLVFHLFIFPICGSLARGTLQNYAVSDALGVAMFLLGTTVLRLQTRLTDWLGTISYSIYLFHFGVYYPLFWWLMQQPAGSAWRQLHLGTYLAVNMLLVVALATLVYHLVERPGIAFGHRLASRWSRDERAPRLQVTPLAD